jgi:heme/copper-type cytochrome/quinol oxidase subunit 4
MGINFGLVLAIAAALALLRSKLSPLPAKPPEERETVPAEPVDERVIASRRQAYGLGFYVLIGLAVLTAAEFGIAVAFQGSVVFLFVIALAKAGAIVQYYMHLNRAWTEEEAHG